MSPEQLYNSGSPLWTKELEVKAIERFYDIENQLNNYGARPNQLPLTEVSGLSLI